MGIINYQALIYWINAQFCRLNHLQFQPLFHCRPITGHAQQGSFELLPFGAKFLLGITVARTFVPIFTKQTKKLLRRKYSPWKREPDNKHDEFAIATVCIGGHTHRICAGQQTRWAELNEVCLPVDGCRKNVFAGVISKEWKNGFGLKPIFIWWNNPVYGRAAFPGTEVMVFPLLREATQ